MTEPAGPKPMPFDLWWSPSMRRFLSRHENQDDEHLVWVVQMNHESLRHYLGTGAGSNPPLPDDAVRLLLADPEQGSELERLRAQVERQHEINAGWVAYKDRKKTEQFRNIEAFEDALGLERAGRGYWYERMIEAAGKVRAERDQLRARVAEQEQALAIVRAQNGECVEQVDAALGHRYHTRGVHYSIPHVAEKSAAEIQQLQARIDAGAPVLDEIAKFCRVSLAGPPYAPDYALRNNIAGIQILATRLLAALQGDQPTEPCHCGGRRWEEDKNWSPQYPELWKGERSPGTGLVPCGTCNFGGWNVAPVEPGQDATLGPRHPAGSPEGHFPIRPQSTGQHHKDTPPVLPGDETPQPEEGS